ncbi:hypothetical protein R3P38DRAFT_2804534 [Favolaschia claudopus]|uniref:Uncharacterized protein n=1 Tax=Favolaschia claudopus TaxID=2862362 RepID=A0AAV9ZPS3_9AGAR
MSTVNRIQTSVSSILEQLATAKKGFGELKDFISSSKEHKLFRHEIDDLELYFKALQRSIIQESLALALNEDIQELVYSFFNTSLLEFSQKSQKSPAFTLKLSKIEVTNYKVRLQEFRNNITALLPHGYLQDYQEHQTQTFEKQEKDQEKGSMIFMVELEDQEEAEANKGDLEERVKEDRSHSIKLGQFI